MEVKIERPLGMEFLEVNGNFFLPKMLKQIREKMSKGELIIKNIFLYTTVIPKTG